jgi:hypothetical protein
MKKEFIMLAIQPWANLRELFRRYGISAPCGYKWLRAYQEKEFAGFRAKESASTNLIPMRLGPKCRSDGAQTAGSSIPFRGSCALGANQGRGQIQGHLFYVGQAFGGQEVAFRPTDKDGCFDLFFSWKKIGHLDRQKVPKDNKGHRFCLTGRTVGASK